MVRLLERIELRPLIEERLTVKRRPAAKGVRDFVLAMVLVAERYFLNAADFVRTAVRNELLRLRTAAILEQRERARK